MGKGVQNFINKAFWGKRVLKPKGKALKKMKMEKKLADKQND